MSRLERAWFSISEPHAPTPNLPSIDDVPPNAVLRLGDRQIVIYYSITVALTMIFALVWSSPWAMTSNGVFPNGGDYLWVQATAEAHARAGVFATDTHLAWPDGYAPWSVPQLGMLFAVLSWIAGGIMGLPSALTVWLILIFVAGLNAGCTLFFFRSLVGDFHPFLSAAAACSLGASPFVLGKVPHLNVANFYIVPLTLGVIAVWQRGDWQHRSRGMAALLLGALLAPLWWVLVTSLLALTLFLPSVLRTAWKRVSGLAVVLLCLLIASSIQTVIYATAVAGGRPSDLSRPPWESNFFGGHLTDILVGSPFLTEVWPRLALLIPGSSAEASPVGLIPGLGAIFAVVLLISGPPRRRVAGFDTTLLADATASSVLLFLVGGLGNLQAGFAVLLGGSSPARTWSRLSVLVALIGLGWLLTLFAAWAHAREAAATQGGPRGIRGAATACVAAVVLLATAADASATPRPSPVPVATFDEFRAVQFLETATKPCPVAQLPQNGFPVDRVAATVALSTSGTAEYYYRGFVPYLLSEDFFWSFGSWVPRGTDGLNALPAHLEPADLSALRQLGFCAVLFDKRLSRKAERLDLNLQGQEFDERLIPDFVSQRYDVYLLGRRR